MKNKKNCIVIGTGGHSRAVISLLNKHKNYVIQGLIEISLTTDDTSEGKKGTTLR